jgi:hypothetical protein
LLVRIDAGDSLGAQSRAEKGNWQCRGSRNGGIDEVEFGDGFANLELVEASLTQACITKATDSGDTDWRGARLLTGRGSF